MALSFQTTIRVAAVGVLLCLVRDVTCYISRLAWTGYHFHLAEDIFQRSAMDMLLLCFIIVAIALMRAMPTHVSRPFRLFTYALAALAGMTVLAIPVFILPYYICGALFLYLPFLIRVGWYLLGFGWLMALAQQPSLTPAPRPMRIGLGIGIAFLALPIMLQIISGLSLLITGRLLFLHSAAVLSWVQFLVPVIFLSAYSVYLFRCTEE